MLSGARFRERSTSATAAVELPFSVVRKEYGERGTENYQTVFEHNSKDGKEVRQVSFYKDVEGEIVRHHHQPHTWIVLYSVCESIPARERYHFLNWQTGKVSSDALLLWTRWCMLPSIKNLKERWALKDSPVDGDLRSLESAIANSHYFPERPRTRLGTAMVRGMEAGEAFGVYATAERQLRLGQRGRHECRTKVQIVYVFPDAAKRVRRRAVLVACTYPDNQPLSPSPSTISDALTFYDVLTGRAWDARDIAILTDAPNSDSIQEIKRDGARIEGSAIDQVAKWMGRLVSGLQEVLSLARKIQRFAIRLYCILPGMASNMLKSLLGRNRREKTIAWTKGLRRPV
jgi:hypothetical protein